MKRILLQSGVLFILAGMISVKANEASTVFNLDAIALIKVFEIIIAGIVASAIILAFFVLFISQWSGKKQGGAIKKIRKEIEKDQETVKKSVSHLNNNALKIQQFLNQIEKKSATITLKQHQAWIHVEDIEKMVEDAAECLAELQQVEQHKKMAKQTMQQFNDDLHNYETQARDQLTSIFQLTDLARQELMANIKESRQHIEKLRYYETERRKIRSQAIDTTENLPSDTGVINNNHSDTSKNNQTQSKTEESNKENTNLKAVSGDSTLVPFFSSTKK